MGTYDQARLGVVVSRKKTVLLVTSDPANRLLYETALRRRYRVEFRPTSMGGSGRIDAIVYDIAGAHGSVDLRWLKNLGLPAVILSPERDLPLPVAPHQRVLRYPVRAEVVLQTLSELGIE